MAVLLSVGAIIFLLDLSTKVLAVSYLEGTRPIRLLGGALYLSFARNTGAAFSLGANFTIVFTTVMIAVTIAILVISRKVRSVPWAIALGLILGGATGNLVDRLFRHPGAFRGGVVDFLSVFDPWGQVWPIFNVADSAIVCGGIMAIILAVLGRDFDGARIAHRESSGRT